MRRVAPPAAGLVLCLCGAACMSTFEAMHEGQSDSRGQISQSEASQVKLRAAQSRVFDTTDRTRILAAVVATMQDRNFMVEVLDEELGIVSGSTFVANIGEPWLDPTYHLYDDQTLVLFSRSYSTWGPFHHRVDKVRLTVTVRKRNDAQSVVRASAQFWLRAIEDPEPYQRFFRALEQAMFLQAQMLEEQTEAAK